MTAPIKLPPLRRYDLCLRGYENTMKRADDGDYCDNDDREARESILVAEIERLRAHASALAEVMAMIHGDGGHYLAKHGAAKAAEDAVEKVSALRAEANRAWASANRAESKVAAWEQTLVVTGLPKRIAPNIGWGPGSSEPVEVPELTPEKLTSILDRLRAAESDRAKLCAEVKAMRAGLVPRGYVMVGEPALREWGKLDEVRSLCTFPIDAARGAK